MEVATQSEQRLPLVVSFIPPTGVVSIAISLTVPTLKNVSLRAWAGPPIDVAALASAPEVVHPPGQIPVSGSLSRPGTECISLVVSLAKDAIGDVLSFNPASACAVSLVKNIWKVIELKPIKHGKPVVYSALHLFADGFAVVLSTGVDCASAWLNVKRFGLFKFAKEAASLLAKAFELADKLPDCFGIGEEHATGLSITAIASFDPNLIVGPTGFGPTRVVAGNQPLLYFIEFENRSTASAPAQRVVVTTQLDPSLLDLKSVTFDSFVIGTNVVSPSATSGHFATRVDLRPTTDVLVDVTGTVAPNGLVTWAFTSIDPATGLPPLDPRIGFLPPNLRPPEGDGGMYFSVTPKAGLATGTVLTAAATIVFDQNAPLQTIPAWTNALDNSAPTSKVTALGPVQASSSFTVSWSGTDVGSGVRDYSVYFADNGSSFTPWLSGTAATSSVFTGTAGHSYAFYLTARDHTGNQETKAAVAEATTRTIGTTSLLPPLGTGVATPSNFDATVSPTVQICAWTGTACAGLPITQFTTQSTTATDRLMVNATVGDFEATWSLLSAALSTRKTYRIRVLLGVTELTGVNVDVVRGRWALTRSDGTLAPLAAANELLVKFRIAIGS